MSRSIDIRKAIAQAKTNPARPNHRRHHGGHHGHHGHHGGGFGWGAYGPYAPWGYDYVPYTANIAYIPPVQKAWQQAVQMASVGQNAQAGQMFEASYPDLAGVRGGMRVGKPERSDAYKKALGVYSPGTPVNAQWASNMLLTAYPSLRWR